MRIIYILVVFMLSGCVGITNGSTNTTVNKQKIKFLEPEDLVRIKPNVSTKEDIRKTLGDTRFVTFDSGYEVWIYQIETKNKIAVNWVDRIEHFGSGRGTLGNDEIVILFDPSGTVTKFRIRQLNLGVP